MPDAIVSPHRLDAVLRSRTGGVTIRERLSEVADRWTPSGIYPQSSAPTCSTARARSSAKRSCWSQGRPERGVQRPLRWSGLVVLEVGIRRRASNGWLDSQANLWVS